MFLRNGKFSLKNCLEASMILRNSKLNIKRVIKENLIYFIEINSTLFKFTAF